MNRKKLNIGLFGFGCVGKGLYDVLQHTHDLNVEIKKICVKNKNKERPIEQHYFTYDAQSIIEDPNIHLIVELIDDADAAFNIIQHAAKAGKAIVTANKKMIAEHFQEILQLQKDYQVPIIYEAACCASIPIIRNLEEYYDNDLLDSIEGIVNGSTNYILTQTNLNQITYQEALIDAQEKGYAESNPILDTGGFDAKYKLVILINHAFGYIAKPKEIYNVGIDNLGELEISFAKEKNYKIKLIAHASRTPSGKIRSFVMPKFIQVDDPLYFIDDVYNGIKIKSCLSDIQFFSGKGAGAFPTASAIISDISALGYQYQYEYKKLNNNIELEDDSNILLKVFLRHDLEYTLEFKRFFNDIEESYLNRESGFIIGVINLRNLKTIAQRTFANTSVVLFEIVNQSSKFIFPEQELKLIHT